MNTMHLFAGIGGGILADLILGHKPIVAVEWDKYACKVLRERVADGWFDGMSVWEGDIRLFDPSEYAGRVDCIHAGFPCQDISVAGKQAGLGEGTRSGLYREVLRIAGVVRPRYLFLENVSAILSNGLGTVLGDLAAMGYDCRWLCIKASDVGAPHGRDRWFALATKTEHLPGRVQAKNGIDKKRRSISDRDFGGVLESATATNFFKGNVGNPKHDGQPTTEVSQSIAAGNGDNAAGESQTIESTRPSEQYAELADTQRDRLQGQWQDWNTEGQIGLCDRARSDEEQDICHATSAGLPNGTGKSMEQSSQESEFERPDWWSTESEVGRLAHGVSNRVGMLKGLGNAQVPLQAATAWRLLTRHD